MMRSIIAWSMQLRLLVLSAAAVLLFFGATQLRTMPVDVLPEFSRPYVEVQTEALGLSASEVESMITVPLEADLLNGGPWVEEIRSESIPGLSSIVMFFEPGVDMLTARQVVQERLVGVHALPAVSKPPRMLQPVSSSNRFMAVGLTSKERSLIEMSVLSRWTLVPRLMGVPGVANVSIWGQRKRQLQVQVDPETLREKGVTLQQIINTTGNSLWSSPLTYLDASTPGTGGWIETPAQRLMIQHRFPISTPADLATVTVEGTSMALGSLATVVEDHQPLIGGAIIDEGPALMLVLEKFPWANTVQVTKDVEEAVAALQLGLTGIEMDSTYFRPATYLDLVVKNLSKALIAGAVLLLLALFAAFFNWRTALISVLSVGVAAMVAVSVLSALDVTLNAMVIAGLMVALLALVDDAVIDIQNITRRLREGGESSTARTIFAGALEMRRPVLYATVILGLAVTPLLLIAGVGGAFSEPIVYAYGLALLASFVTAMMVVPALSLLLLGDGAAAAGSSPILGSAQAAFDAIVARTSRLPGKAMAGAVALAGLLVVGGLYAMDKSGATVFPNFKERDVVISMDALPGTSEHAMSRGAARMSAELRALPGVRAVSAHVGRAVTSDKTNNINGGEVWVSISRAADYEATVEAIHEVATGYAGFDIDVDTFLSERLKDQNGPINKLVVRVYGEDMGVLRQKAEEVRGVLARVDGIESPEVQYPDLHPNLEIEPILSAAKQHGLTPGEVRRAAATLLSGIEVGSLFEDQKVFDVVVWGTPNVRHSLSSVENLLLDKPGGGHVRLKEVASTRLAPHPTVIKRNAVARHLDIDAEVVGRGAVAVAADATAKIRASVDFPLEYRAEVLGGHATAAAAANRVRTVAIAAGIGVLLLMQAAFGSWSLAAIMMVSLPVSLVGGLMAASLFGEVSALGSMLGLLAVLTLAVRHAMTLVAHYRDLEKQGATASPELVQRGTRERFAPMVTTALAAGMAFLPFAFLGNVAGLEILHSMSITVLGGLVSSTLVSLLVVPSLYLGFGGSAEPEIIVQEEAA